MSRIKVVLPAERNGEGEGAEKRRRSKTSRGESRRASGGLNLDLDGLDIK